jgi:hypothetical protein
MNLPAIRTALATLIATYCQVAAAHVYWRGRPRGWTGKEYAVLNTASIRSSGRDEVVWVHDPLAAPGSELTPHAVGQRATIWTVQIWSHSAANALAAVDRLTVLRDALELPVVVDALRAVGLGVDSAAPIHDISDLQDDRELSVAQLDIRLWSTSDKAGSAIGYAEHWGITGTATPPGATPIDIMGGEVVVP